MNKYLSTFIILSFKTLVSIGQSGSLDLTFNVGTGANNFVQAISIQGDGKIIIGGSFTVYNNIARGGIVRLNTDGSLDTTFNRGSGISFPDTNGILPSILSTAIQSDGKIVIGGHFNAYNGTSANYLARINTDGTLDTAFNTGTGTDADVRAVTIQTDGRIIIGGIFNMYNGVLQNKLARVNTDGALDTTFNTGSGADGGVNTIAIQSDGKIVMGGDFVHYNGIYAERITRIDTDGIKDSGFNAALFGVGANKVVNSIALESNGEILIGGNFTNYQGQTRNGVALLVADGSLDGNFNPPQGLNPGSWLNVVLVQSSGEFFIGGTFDAFNGTTINNIAVIDHTARLDNSFNPGSGPDYAVLCAAIQANGKILIGGSFTAYDSISRNDIARLDACTLPQPGPVAGDTTTLCADTAGYSIFPVSGADNYIWTLPSGWIGSSDSSSILATSNGTGGVISVIANSSLCGVSIARSDTVIQVEAPDVPICLVTVDTQSTHNIVIWDKPQTGLIDSFFIYREITTNNYAKITAVPYDSLSEYNDNAANPNTTSFRYKISTLDVCGVESALSLYHNTINLQNLGAGNFQWTFYEIENSANPVLSFNIYRDDSANGNFIQIGLVPGTNSTFTDITYRSFPNAVYVVDVNWGISCDPTRSISTTRSNIRNGSKISSLSNENSSLNELYIYPNPTTKLVNFSLPPSLGITGLKLFNSVGQTVWSEVAVGTGSNGVKQLNIENFASGVYTLLVETNLGRVSRKLIIE